MAASGRGAWTLRGKDNETTFYARVQRKDEDPLPRDGSQNYPSRATAETKSWYDAVHYGVLAIEAVLVDLGHLAAEDSEGVFKMPTKRAVEAFQDANGLSVDGKVGMRTMDVLLRPIILDAARDADTMPRFIYAFARQESGFDPGAQGWTTPHDLGVWQFNTDYTEIADATDIKRAAHLVSHRFAAALEEYDGKSRELQVDCAILQHRSPEAADYLYRTGTDLGAESRQYIDSVRAFSTGW